jgi:hypothetical protein
MDSLHINYLNLEESSVKLELHIFCAYLKLNQVLVVAD